LFAMFVNAVLSGFAIFDLTENNIFPRRGNIYQPGVTPSEKSKTQNPSNPEGVK
jgi:hypothetical protein